MSGTRCGRSRYFFIVVTIGIFFYGFILSNAIVTKAQSQIPKVGDFFEYQTSYGLRDGTGWYSDWWEQTTENGRYEITNVAGDAVTFQANFSWHYSDSEGMSESASNSCILAFNASSRFYLQYLTDDDEYNFQDGRTLGVWFWVHPDLQRDQDVLILDDLYMVTSEQSTVWSNNLPIVALTLQASGTFTRNYDGKSWTGSTYTDQYFIDRDSGYTFSERYVERNQGTLNSEYTTWTWYVDYDVTSSSFTLEIDVLTILGIIAGIIIPILCIGYIAHVVRWRTKTLSFPIIGMVKISLLKTPDSYPSHLNPSEATDYFGPFLEDFTKKTLLAKGRVAIAKGIKDDLIGVAYYNREEQIGAIHCKDTEVTEALRAYVGCKDFFSEVRHKTPARDLIQFTEDGEAIRNLPEAYNVFETYQVLKISDLQPMEYDTHLISYMREEDLPAVEHIAKEVYSLKDKRTLRALLESGDIGFVAKINGVVVGFAFTSFVKQQGRNHTLTVLPKYQNLGLGKELTRARLSILYNLGATSVITEIADWNLASLRVSNSFGFKRIGSLLVETNRSTRIKKNIVRW